jgi:hypothetical protein
MEDSVFGEKNALHGIQRGEKGTLQGIQGGKARIYGNVSFYESVTVSK